jgi:predicted N-acyltransferase
LHPIPSPENEGLAYSKIPAHMIFLFSASITLVVYVASFNAQAFLLDSRGPPLAESSLFLRSRRSVIFIEKSVRLEASSTKPSEGDNQERTNNVEERTIEFKLHSSIGSIPPDAWDACLTESSSPFLHHSWLRCLEDSKCASPSTGWVPQHVSISIDGDTAGYVILYIKGHSLGEFIFDQQFSEAAYQNGIEYYPKLLVGVPFTPATGHRILWHPESVLQSYSREEMGQLNRAVADFLKQIAISNKLSSVHFNFLTEDEASDLGGPLETTGDRREGESGGIRSRVEALFQRLEFKDDYLRRTSLQYHWTNSNPGNGCKPFESFDAYLDCFKSKKRINIRRERRKVLEDENVKIDIVSGKDILEYDGLVERMFEIYVSTIDKMIWGRQYLTLEFFQMLSKSDFIHNLVFVCARKGLAHNEELKAKDVFAGTFSKCLANI